MARVLLALVKFFLSVLAAISGLHTILAQRDVALGVALFSLSWAMTTSARLDLAEEKERD